MKRWANREIEIACKHENPNWDGKSFDYGCSCYQSALKAYDSLLEDGHSGFSFSLTKKILIRLMEGLPLTPITDEDFFTFKSEINESPDYLKEQGLKSDIQCQRMYSLFRKETLDGKVSYTDVKRVTFHDANGDGWWKSGKVRDLIDEMFPITMPYFPSKEKYKVYGETFYIENGEDKSAKHIGEYNLTKLYYVVTPTGEKIELNKEYEC